MNTKFKVGDRVNLQGTSFTITGFIEPETKAILRSDNGLQYTAHIGILTPVKTVESFSAPFDGYGIYQQNPNNSIFRFVALVKHEEYKTKELISVGLKVNSEKEVRVFYINKGYNVLMELSN